MVLILNSDLWFFFLFDLIEESTGKFAGWWRIVVFRPFGAIEIMVLNEIFLNYNDKIDYLI